MKGRRQQNELFPSLVFVADIVVVVAVVAAVVVATAATVVVVVDLLVVEFGEKAGASNEAIQSRLCVTWSGYKF